MNDEGRSAMRAVAMDRFGGPEVLEPRNLPVPEVGPGEVLIRVEAAGVGEWDPFEREGGYAKMLGIEPKFPYVLGSEGAGTVAALGEGVDRFEEGDRVYAAGFLNPKGGFYAEYAAVDAGLVSRVPDWLPTGQAGAMSGVALTALRGLGDVLALKPDESVAIFGAGGEAAEELLSAVRAGGRAAFPNGVQPVPRGGPGVQVSAYNAEPDAGNIGRLGRLIGQGPFEVHVARTFRLEEARDAHRALEGHYLGKLALRTR